MARINYKHSEETKRKIGRANKGKISPITIAASVKAHLGVHRLEETKRKIGAYWKGRKRTPRTAEHSKKLGLCHIGKIPANKGKISEYAGDKHWNWKGGITSDNNRIRISIEYRLWREAVFARDNWTCQKTGKKGGDLVAHHINNFSEYPELRFAIDNGITLSEKAHKEFHKKYGRHNNTREQLIKFLNN